MAFNDVFGGSTVQPSDVSYRAVVLSASIVVSWPPYTDDGNFLARIMDVTPSTTGLGITLPNATLASPGETAQLRNLGINDFTVYAEGGGIVTTVTPGQTRIVYLQSNATAAGVWTSIALGTGSSAPDAAALAGYGLQAYLTTLQQAYPFQEIASDTVSSFVDRAKTFVWTGATGDLELPTLASVGNTFFFQLRNQGSGALAVLPVGGSLIDGSASISLQANESCIVCAGTAAWYTIGRGRSAQFNFTQLIKTVTGGTETLSLSEAANVVQTYNGVLASNQIVVVPAFVQVYYFNNLTTGAFTFTVKSPVVGNTVVIASGDGAVVFCDGTNVYVLSPPGPTGPAGAAGPAGPTGATGPTGPAGGTLTYLAKTANYTILAADNQKFIDCTANTFTLTFTACATLGSTWYTYIRNTGAGIITLDPNGAELIDGAANITLQPQTGCLVQCDGSALRTFFILPRTMERFPIFSAATAPYKAVSTLEFLENALATTGLTVSRQVIFGNSLFICSGGGATEGNVASSPDGVTWTLRAMPSSTGWHIGTDGTQFVATVAAATTTANSTNGTTWGGATALPGNANNNYPAPCFVGTTGLVLSATASTAYTTTNYGSSWTTQTLPATANGSANGPFSVGGVFWYYNTGTTAYTSATGATASWTSRTLPVTPATNGVWQDFDGALIMAASATGNYYRSTDGINWTDLGFAGLDASNLTAVLSINSVYALFDATFGDAASRAGSTWVARRTALTYNGSQNRRVARNTGATAFVIPGGSLTVGYVTPAAADAATAVFST